MDNNLREQIRIIEQWAKQKERSSLVIINELVDNQPFTSNSVVAKDENATAMLTLGILSLMKQSKDFASIIDTALNIYKK